MGTYSDPLSEIAKPGIVRRTAQLPVKLLVLIGKAVWSILRAIFRMVVEAGFGYNKAEDMVNADRARRSQHRTITRAKRRQPPGGPY